MSTRGAIEQADGRVVSGWVHRTDDSLDGVSVLAFLGKDCIGTARVEIQRADILAAGLGDGKAGFHMETLPVPRDQRHRVYVRLAGDDAVFVFPQLLTAELRDQGLTLAEVEAQLQSLRWMKDKGWLSQAEADALRTMLRFGAYETNVADAQGGASLIDQGKGALQKLLSTVQRRDVEVEATYCRDPASLEQAIAAQAERGRFEYYALWSTERARVTIAEGSHIAASDDGPAQHAAGVDYEFGGSQMLVLDPKVTLLNKESSNNQILLFSSVRPA